MVTCEICGREFKNTQGLKGHKTFVHSESSYNSVSATQSATEEKLSILEDRLEKLEYITGLRDLSIIDKTLNTEKPFTEQLAEANQQLNSLAHQLASLSNNTASNTDMERISEQVTQLTQQLISYSKWFKPVKTVVGRMSYLENELSNRAENTRVNALENRIVHSEEERQEGRRAIIEQIKNNKVFTDAEIRKILECIAPVLDRFAALLKQIQSQLKEQEQVTDWVKKEYNLKTVQKMK